MKPDRMAAYEAPRQSDPGRAMIAVTLVWRGTKTGVGASHRSSVRIPKMAPMPSVVTCEGRIFLRQTDERYAETSPWPIIAELDGV